MQSCLLDTVSSSHHLENLSMTHHEEHVLASSLSNHPVFTGHLRWHDVRPELEDKETADSGLAPPDTVTLRVLAHGSGPSMLLRRRTQWADLASRAVSLMEMRLRLNGQRQSV